MKILGLLVGVLTHFLICSAAICKRQATKMVTRGVNLGGLFVLEPWIKPSLFQPWEYVANTTVVDEWNYCLVLGKQECQRRLQQHWNSWVTESDISTLAQLQINTLRIPIGYWAFTVNADEPYVQGQLPYLERILRWAQQYQLQVILDLHGAPGSQNGFDNSGRRGAIRWTKRPQDIPRSLDSLAAMAQIAQRHPSTVVGIEAVNEPANWGVPKSIIIQYYREAQSRVKSIAPQANLVLHDAFLPESQWRQLIPPNSDSTLDTHIYHVFSKQDLELSAAGHLSKARADGRRLAKFNQQTRTIVGEFSLATTDCARWLNGFQRGSRWDGTYLTKGPVVPGGSCQGEEDMRAWSAKKREFVRDFGRAQLEGYEMAGGWIFWNFKTEAGADNWDFIKLATSGLIQV